MGPFCTSAGNATGNEALVGGGDSAGVVADNWMGPAWKMKPKFVGIGRALEWCMSECSWCVCRVVYTQLLSVASYGAHGGRLPDCQQLRFDLNMQSYQS